MTEYENDDRYFHSRRDFLLDRLEAHADEIDRHFATTTPQTVTDDSGLAVHCMMTDHAQVRLKLAILDNNEAAEPRDLAEMYELVRLGRLVEDCFFDGPELRDEFHRQYRLCTKLGF